jgi:uncharacterized phage protein (TIGR02220 family)
MSDSGWIILHRKIRSSDLWPITRPYSELEAWLDILLTVDFDGDNKGTCRITIRELAKRWDWNKNKVHRFLQALVVGQRVRQEWDKNGTLLTVENWDLYQRCGTRMGQKRDTKRDKKPVSSYIKIKEDLKKIYSVDVDEIVNHLNTVAGTSYQPETKETHSLILARAKEGYTNDNFITVIDKKAHEWKGDPKMGKYLRPKTLFAADKFEGYLNQPAATPRVPERKKNDEYTGW